MAIAPRRSRPLAGMVILIGVAAMLAAGGCRAGSKSTPPATNSTTTPAPAPQPAPAVAEAPPPPAPGPAAPDPETWRPSWWTPSAIATPETMSIAAMAEDVDLLAARRKAVDSAMGKLREAIGKEPKDSATKVDSIKLPDGRYRAFVLVTGKLN